MSQTTFTTLEVERPMEGVAVVRLMEPPVGSESDRVLECVGRTVRDMPIVVLTGPGWLATAGTQVMTAALIHDLRAGGAEVSIGAA